MHLVRPRLLYSDSMKYSNWEKRDPLTVNQKHDLYYDALSFFFFRYHPQI